MGIKSDLDDNYDLDIVDEFLDHYSMMVESMNVMIADLTRDNMQKRSIDELFRVFHNIQSASGYLKISPMERLATLVEAELEELRNKNKTINKETVGWLMEINDMFSIWLQNLRNDEELTKIKFSLLRIPDTGK